MFDIPVRKAFSFDGVDYYVPVNLFDLPTGRLIDLSTALGGVFGTPDRTFFLSFLDLSEAYVHGKVSTFDFMESIRLMRAYDSPAVEKIARIFAALYFKAGENPNVYDKEKTISEISQNGLLDYLLKVPIFSLLFPSIKTKKDLARNLDSFLLSLNEYESKLNVDLNALRVELEKWTR